MIWHDYGTFLSKNVKPNKIKINIIMENTLQNTEPMLSIENLSKYFRTEEVETIALNHVSLQVASGEFVIDELNVFENVELPLIYMRIPAKKRKEMVNEILQRMNISHRAGHFPQQLSGGQQQRVAIARAVVAQPKLILADEPTGNLDTKNGQEVMMLLSELNREGTTVIMVTHSQRDSTYAHRIINLLDGQIVDSVKNNL